MSEFVQCFLILAMFLGFLFALFCGYVIQVRDKDKNFTATKESRNNKKK
ncbi:hypothetical protein HYH38_15995 [Clostridium botulinum]|uniref:Uncharacterized protein n=1 Tax=Clostridium botulinum TaxID=1491 RepID=A0A126JI13_CLOBO|nr:hypothetical protein [Clostridium botulinum]ALT05350.1 hypothetical protein [Clostridium botulinum]MBY6810965.1 hypothetical protein [Clostridium botulinum]MBY6818442.1 hypothetical protein [Clostridium botulinum]MBY6824433.1 hypothetical protein [Clostridium botulinum]MBY6828736.1 hypothetical protein [Clostridium botulinum]